MEFLYTSQRLADGHFRHVERRSCCVLLHGLFGSSDNLKSVEAMLAINGLSTISYDLPNHGRSPLLEECTFIAMARMLHASLERDVLGTVDSVHILGHSLGGKLAGVYAMLYPNTIASLVVLDIAPVEYPPFHAKELHALVRLSEAMPTLTSREEARALIQQEISDPLVVGFLMKNVVANEAGKFSLCVQTRPLQNYYDALRAFPEDQLKGKHFGGPTLFVRALGSEYMLPEYFAAIEHFFPSWELEEIDAGHVLHLERPAELRTVLTQFYSSLS